MQASSAPTKVPLPFANAGARNTIPTASQIGTTPGAASLTDGFPPLTRTPIAAGGVPPSGQDMNGILYLLSANIQWENAGGFLPYDAAFSTAIGGYPKGAILAKSGNNGFWMSTVDNNTSNPDSGGANWIDVLGGRLLRTLVYTNVGGTQYVSINGGTATTAGASTYTPSANMSFVDVESNGGGGAGAGAAGATASTVSLGAPGAAGSYGRGIFSAAQVGAAVSISIGTGGNPAAGGAGATGSTSSFGSLLSTPGGSGGGSFTAQTPPATNGNGVASGSVNGGNVLALTFTAVQSLAFNTSTGYGGPGGTGFFGPGGAQVGFNTNGGAGVNPGSGGSGVSINQAGGTASGGKGANGILIVREYA